MESFFGYQNSGWSYESLKNFRQISPVVQNHLKLVYLTLCAALAASAAGAYLHVLLNIGGFLTLLGCVVCISWLLATFPYEEKKRFCLLMAASAFQGASIGPLIDLVIDFDPSVSVHTIPTGCGGSEQDKLRLLLIQQCNQDLHRWKHLNLTHCNWVSLLLL